MEEEEAQLSWSRHPVVEAALKCYGHDLVAARCMVEWPAMAAHNTLHTIPRHATAMHVSVGFFGQCARAKYACRQRLEEEEEAQGPPAQAAPQGGQQQHLLSASELCPQMVAVGHVGGCVGVNVAAGCTRLHGGQIRWGRVSRVLVNGEVVTHTSGLVREGEQGSEVLWQGDHRLYVNAAVAVGDHLRVCLGGSQWIALRVGGFRQSKAVCHASRLLVDLAGQPIVAAEPMLLPCGSPMLFNVADIDVPHGEMAFAVDAVRLLLHEWEHFRGDEVVYKTGGRGMHIVAPHYDVMESVEVPCVVAEPYTIRIPKESYRYWMAQCAHIGVIHTHAKPRTWQIATCRREGDYVVLGVDGWDETVGDRMPNPLYEQRVGVPATIERRKMRPRVEDYLLSKHPTSVLNRMHMARLHHCSQSHGGGRKRKRTRGGGGGGKAATPMDTMAHFRSMIDRLGRSPNHLLKLGSAERTPTRVSIQPRGERHLVDVPGIEPREIFGNTDLFRRIHYGHEVKMESHLRKAAKGWRGLVYEDDPAFASTSS